MDSLPPATAIAAPLPAATRLPGAAPITLRPAPTPGNPAGRRAHATGGTP